MILNEVNWRNVLNDRKAFPPDVEFLLSSKVSACHRRFYGHRILLAAVSPVFQSELFKEESSLLRLTKDKERIIIIVDDSSPAAFQKMLEFIYYEKPFKLNNSRGEINDTEGISLILETLHLAVKYRLVKLKSFCEETLSKTVVVDANNYREVQRLMLSRNSYGGTACEDLCEKFGSLVFRRLKKDGILDSASIRVIVENEVELFKNGLPSKFMVKKRLLQPSKDMAELQSSLKMIKQEPREEDAVQPVCVKIEEISEDECSPPRSNSLSRGKPNPFFLPTPECNNSPPRLLDSSRCSALSDFSTRSTNASPTGSLKEVEQNHNTSDTVGLVSSSTTSSASTVNVSLCTNFAALKKVKTAKVTSCLGPLPLPVPISGEEKVVVPMKEVEDLCDKEMNFGKPRFTSTPTKAIDDLSTEMLQSILANVSSVKKEGTDESIISSDELKVLSLKFKYLNDVEKAEFMSYVNSLEKQTTVLNSIKEECR